MLTKRFFIVLGAAIALAIGGGWLYPLYIVSICLTAVLAAASVTDAVIVVVASLKLRGHRQVADYLSFAQPNPVTVTVRSLLPGKWDAWLEYSCSDTPPYTFKVVGRNGMDGLGTYTYNVVPQGRGRYEFGVVRCFVTTRWIGLIRGRRFLRLPRIVKVYPTFLHLDKLEIMADQQSKYGNKRLRRAGNSTDFNQIRAYVPGDDVRTINWRASARANSLMVNTYTDERSRPIIPVLCAGPSMLIESDGISLLDRAASAAIALASSAIRHYDEAGLITVAHNGVTHYMQHEKSSATVPKMLEATYAFGLPPTESERELIDDPDVLPDYADTDTLHELQDRVNACQADADYHALADFALARLKRRSLIVLFANFENLTIARQALPALLRISQKHTLAVILFKNESVEATAHPNTDQTASNKLSDMRLRAMCGHYIEQQRKLAAFLREQHINVIFTEPASLTSSVLSAYLDLKNRGVV